MAAAPPQTQSKRGGDEIEEKTSRSSASRLLILKTMSQLELGNGNHDDDDDETRTNDWLYSSQSGILIVGAKQHAKLVRTQATKSRTTVTRRRVRSVSSLWKSVEVRRNAPVASSTSSMISSTSKPTTTTEGTQHHYRFDTTIKISEFKSKIDSQK